MYVSYQRFGLLAELQFQHRTAKQFQSRRPLIIGHRGAGVESDNLDLKIDGVVIGNTRQGIQRAIDSKTNWIEIDVRLTEDEVLILFHDAEPYQKTDLTPKNESNPKHIEQLQWSALKNAKLSALSDEPCLILRLEDIWDEFGGTHNWILDIKFDSAASKTKIQEHLATMRKKIEEQLADHQVPTKKIIIFGDQPVMKAFHGSDFRLGYTALWKTHKAMLWSHSYVFDFCEKNQCDLLVVPVDLATPYLLSRAIKEGIETWTYASEDPRDHGYAVSCGVTGLIVDHPEKAIKAFQHLPDLSTN